jgi:murein DD-endopeptidase MepM/ murein hydrolase activator NlpD
VYLLAGLMLVVAIAGTATVVVNFPQSFAGLKAPKKSLAEASAELFSASGENSIENQEPEALAKYLLEDSQTEIDEKMKLLVEEFVRVRSYEKAIQSKLTVLDTLIQNALELDHTLLRVQSKESEDKVNILRPEAVKPQAMNTDSLIEEGVGGGDWSDVEISESQSGLGRVTLLEQQDTVSSIERSIEVLSNIPIGAPIDGRRTSGFGKRRSPFSKRWHMHRGIDIAVARRSPVLATADGTVVSSRYMRGYGRTIKIDHGNGIQTVYGHLQKMMVKKSDKVCRGQQIGQVGSSGRSTGPHLHYEVRVNGIPKNPTRFVKLAEFIRLAKLN